MRRAFGEGDQDRVLIEIACEGAEIEVPGPGRRVPQGREAVIERATGLVQLLSPDPVILVLDRNGAPPEKHERDVETALRAVPGANLRRHGPWFLGGHAPLRLVLAGCPEDSLLKELGVTRFAGDDYVLKVLLDATGHQEFVSGARTLGYRPKDVAETRMILDTLAGELRRLGIGIDASKRYLDLFRGAVGVRPSLTSFAADVLRRAPANVRDPILASLRAEILEAPPSA